MSMKQNLLQKLVSAVFVSTAKVALSDFDEADAASRALNSELALSDFNEAGCAAILLRIS